MEQLPILHSRFPCFTTDHGLQGIFRRKIRSFSKADSSAGPDHHREANSGLVTCYQSPEVLSIWHIIHVYCKSQNIVVIMSYTIGDLHEPADNTLTKIRLSMKPGKYIPPSISRRQTRKHTITKSEKRFFVPRFTLLSLGTYLDIASLEIGSQDPEQRFLP